MAEVQTQDGLTLRLLMGVEQGEELPRPLLDKYFEIQRMRHRLSSGPMSVDALLLVVVSSGILSLTADGNGEPAMEEDEILEDDDQELPGREMPNGALMEQGREYFIYKDGKWETSRFICKAPHGMLKFEGPGQDRVKVRMVQPYHVRLTS